MPVSIACLVIPDLPLASVYRSHPRLEQKPVAVCESDDSDAPILSVSTQASVFGIRRGMSRSQAKALLPDVLVFMLAQQWLRSALHALRDVALSFSPRVSKVDSDSVAGLLHGHVYLDAKGLYGLYGDENRLGRVMAHSAQKLGLDIRVGLSDVVHVAKLAALSATDTAPVRIVAKGTEQKFLAPLSLDILSLPAQLRRILDSFGINTLGKLASLPERGLKLRLGHEGMMAWRLSRGEPVEHFVSEQLRESFAEFSDTAWPMDRLEPVLAELEQVFVRLSHRLGCRGFVARALLISLDLESGDLWEHEVQPASPCLDTRVWLDAARLVLQAEPPKSPVEKVGARAFVLPARPGQGDLFRRTVLVSSRKLDEVLARLGAVAVTGGVGSPRLLNTHRPDPVEMAPVGRGGADFMLSCGDTVAIRRFRPPLRVEVLLGHGRPVRLDSPVFGGRIVRAAGPFSLRWGWWEDRAVQRDYYDVELSSGGLYRLFFDAVGKRWFADGVLG